VDAATRTFRIRNIGGVDVVSGGFADAVSYSEPDMERAWTSFSNGSDGYVKAGGGETLQTEEASLSTFNEMQAADALYGTIN